MALTEFYVPTGFTQMTVTTVSSSKALPAVGTPTVARIYNASAYPVAVLIGASAGTVTPATGMVIAAGDTETVATGAFISAILLNDGPFNGTLFISTGT